MRREENEAQRHLSMDVRLILLLLIGYSFVIADDVLQYSIQEESQLDSTIGHILRDSGLADKHSREVLKELRFQFLSEPRGNISLERTSGRLYVGGRLDREDLCPRKNVCEVLLDIAVHPVHYFQIIKVAITVEDINDNQPQFPEPSFTLSILESAALDSAFSLPSARDNDSPANGVTRYSLVPDSPRSKFSLKTFTKLDGSVDVRLVLKRKLDRESRDHYDLQLVAYDGGTAPQSGGLNINVHVIDSNDNEPVFQQDSYEISVLENADPGTMVVQVQAEDIDDGVNGKVVYGFSLQTETNYGHLFGINRDNGKVIIKGEVDYEVSTIYHLVVTAQDLGPDSSPSDTTVVIHVQDVNDNTPDIKINTLTSISADYAEIAEDSPLGTFVAHVSVKDNDDGRNGQVNCSIRGEDFLLQMRYSKEYQIITASYMDREIRSEYDISLSCRDLGDKPLTATKELKIRVSDVNDNEPEFSSLLYTGTVLENNYRGAFILQVNASDRDAGINAQLSFSVSGRDSFPFEVNNQGRIYARQPMDREEQQTYRFDVVACDGGIPSKSSTSEVQITIEDVNDERPVFTEPSYVFSVTENQSPGLRIGSVQAIDKDSPPLNEHLFSFIPVRGTEQNFDLDPISGVIRTRRALDCEEQTVYHLLVKASDSAEPSMTATASITIYIKDLNDNAPAFTFPSKLNNTVHISNMMSVGHIVTTVGASDPDLQQNGLVTYSFAADSETEDLFTINPKNGTIKLNRDVSEIAYREYKLQVTAMDQGQERRTTEARLNIVVNRDIPFTIAEKPTKRVTPLGQNFILVIGLSCGSALVTIILVVAIILLRKKDRSKREHKYNCRMEALRMLTAKETLNDSNTNGKANMQQYEQVPKEDPSQPGSPKRAYRKPYHEQNQRPWVLSNKEMEVHHLLHAAPNQEESHVVEDIDSVHSGEDSNTDSGKGPSEDGEKNHRLKGRIAGDTGSLPGRGQQHRAPRGYPSHSYSQTPSRLQSFSPRSRAPCDTSPSPIPEDEEPVWQLMEPGKPHPGSPHNSVRSDFCTYRPPACSQSGPVRVQRLNGTLPRVNPPGRGTDVTNGIIV